MPPLLFLLAAAALALQESWCQEPPPPGQWGMAPPPDSYPEMWIGGEMPPPGEPGQQPKPPPKTGQAGRFRGKGGAMAKAAAQGSGPPSGRPQPSRSENAELKAKVNRGQHKCAELDLIWLWPDATMVYTIADGISDECKENITAAMEDITWATDNYILFREKTNADKDWVDFINTKSGCNSELGRIGGYQYTNLAVGCCAQGTVMHEILHNLGFNHMHTRADRDDFVTVVTDSIQSGYTANFAKYNSSVTLLGSEKREFDYNSIMMYPTNAFLNTTAGNVTILLPYDVDDSYVGQRDAMTDTDIGILQDVYAECYAERRAKTGEALVENSDDYDYYEDEAAAANVSSWTGREQDGRRGAFGLFGL